MTAATPSLEGRLAGLLILVAEDDLDSRDALQQVLTFEGAAVRLAEDGAAALRRLERPRRRPDVLLIDLMMPVLDGFQLANRVRTDPRWSDIPMVAITARVAFADYHATLQAGFAAHVAKPFEPDELVGAIQRVAGPRRARPGGQHGTDPGMTRRPMAERTLDALRFVEDLARLVSESATALEAAPAPSWAVHALRQTRDALRFAARRRTDQLGLGPSPTPDGASKWRHALGGQVSAITGWAHVYRAAPDDARRTIALDGIERTTAALHRLLAELSTDTAPGGSSPGSPERAG